MGPKSWVLAIDFGTSYSVAAAAVDGESPRMLEIDGYLRVPSVILVDGDTIVVGRVADEMSGARPADVLRTPKTRLGDQAPVILAGRTFQVGPLVGALLGRIYREAISQFGSPPREVRLTHPATWNRTRQAKLLEAGARAGLPASTLVPEPVAAALSYWNDGELPLGGFVAVYDLGGGTFDSAVLQASADGFRIVGRPDGDPSIGGELFDELVVNIIGAELDPNVWEKIQLANDPSWRQLSGVLRKEARRAKETLSNYDYADILVPLPTGLTPVRVGRNAFENAVAPYIDDSVELMRRCISEAGVSLDDLTAIQLVGGSSRIPAVETALRKAFPGLAMHRRGDPKNSVAFGALIARNSSITPTPTGYGSSEDPRGLPVAPALPIPAPAAPAFSSPSLAEPTRAPATVRPAESVPTNPRAAVEADLIVGTPDSGRSQWPAPPTIRAVPTAWQDTGSGMPVAPAPFEPGRAPKPSPGSKRKYALLASIVVVALTVAAVVLATRDDGARQGVDTEVTETTENSIEGDRLTVNTDDVAPVVTDSSAPEASDSTVTTTIAETSTTSPASSTTVASSTTMATVAVAPLSGGMRMTVDLRPEAVWEDGSPITYRDLQCTWQANLNTPGALTTAGFDLITAIDAGASDKQAVITFSSVYGPYRTLFNQIISAASVADCNDVSGDFDSPPVSGREWRIESWNEAELVLVPNESYWGDRTPTARRVVMRALTDSDEDVAALQTGAVDFIYPFHYPGIIDALASAGVAAQLTYGQNGLVEALYLQVGSGPFQDEAFRAGFLQSIDSDALFGQTYRSYDAGASRSKCGPTVPGAYCPAGAFVNKYDPAGAEATLAAAGYSRNADGLWARDGVVPQIRWAVSSGNLRREKAQEYLIPLLVAAGFDVIADNCDFECIFVDRLPAGDFDVAMFGTVNSVDPRDLTLQFSCDSISAESNNFSGQNFQFWCDPAASEALHQADVTLDPAVRAELVKQAITAMDAANIMVPLFQFPNVSAYRTDRLADVEAQLANHRAFNDFWRWQDVDGDGQIVIGAPDWPSCLNPITDCANASWYQWTIANPVLPGIWETTNEGGFAITDLVTGEPVVELI